MKKKNEYNRNEYVQFSDNSQNRRCFLEVFFFKYGFVFVNVNNNPNWFWSMHFIYNLSLHSGFFLHRDNILVRYINACCLYWLKSLGIHCLHYALCLFYLKLILRISRYRIIVTHQDKAKVNNKLKNRPFCILYITVSLLSRHVMLLALRDETKILHPWRPCDILNWDTIDYLLPFQPLDLSTLGRTSHPIWNP